jgi:hypothetical protein
MHPDLLLRRKLRAELDAMNLWDRLLAQGTEPRQIEKDAGRARWFRRTQVMQLLMSMVDTGLTIN